MSLDPNGSPRPGTASPPRSPSGRRPVLLLLDDDRAHRLILRTLLEPHGAGGGFHVEEAEGCSVARDLATRHLRSGAQVLVWSDQRLADGNGLEFFRTLRREHPRAPITCVLASASSYGIETRALREAGVARFVEKPLDLDDYETLVAEVVADWRRTWPLPAADTRWATTALGRRAAAAAKP